MHTESLSPSATPDTSNSNSRRFRAHRKDRIIVLAAVLIPFAGLITAIALLWGVAMNWVYLGLLIGMYLVTAVGITVGYHRLFTHKSFETNRVIKFLLAVFGSMAVQGPVIQWVAVHRKHHQHSDDHDDPHSPHSHAGGTWGKGIFGTLRGLAHAHLGWLLNPHPRGLARYTRDLRADPIVLAVSRQFTLWVLVGLLLPAVLGGLLTMSWMGVFLGFLWGGLVRVFLVHHVTWSVNSICHLWGYQSFRSHDESRNNPIVGILGLGEGWHNNHHAFPASARHGLNWWEIDLSYMLIRGMEMVGLASSVRVPPRERIESKRQGR